MKEILNKHFFNNSISDYILTLSLLVLVFVIYWFCRQLIEKKISQRKEMTSSKLNSLFIRALLKNVVPFTFLLINYFIINRLHFTPRGEKILDFTIYVVVIFFVIRIINYTLHLSVQSYMQLKGEPEARMRQINGILMVIKGLVWITGFLMLLDLKGYDIKTILTGLGVGGIAIALAAQNILSDLFSYFVIFLDKPFEVGNIIKVNNQVGTVEHIGIKTTHIRDIMGELLIFPNAELVKTPLQNISRLNFRRAVVPFDVKLDTSATQLDEMTRGLEALVLSVEHTEFLRACVTGFGEYSIKCELIFNIHCFEYRDFANYRQQVILKLIVHLESLGIRLAQPVRIINSESIIDN